MADTGTKANTLLIAGLIVAATVGGMVWMHNSNEAEADEANQPVEEEVIEIEPMISRAKIAEASWRTGATEAAPAPDDEDASVIDAVDWEHLRGTGEGKAKYNESLRKAMDRVQGLGVVVADEDDEEETNKKKKAPGKRK